MKSFGKRQKNTPVEIDELREHVKTLATVLDAGLKRVQYRLDEMQAKSEVRATSEIERARWGTARIQTFHLRHQEKQPNGQFTCDYVTEDNKWIRVSFPHNPPKHLDIHVWE
jgi:hypothetical protein